MGNEWLVSENMLDSFAVFVKTSIHLAQDFTKNAKAKEARLVRDMPMQVSVKRMQVRCPCSGICFLCDQDGSEMLCNTSEHRFSHFSCTTGQWLLLQVATAEEKERHRLREAEKILSNIQEATKAIA